ncbi:histidine utilization repressor [Phenylobacterium sp. LH3H17]|uniref:histidine utilization repressor n=1 Tax=Phenylobacterium sp. LH3H17 TaxID=2903901 RepID=UPI0020C9B4B0|nr:histidine utilization repressor [Phenylobacterium sp. LH3H17]UTP38095.1 histidine utilization repressor [Phenylobacterium sp. LH3H17]
MTAPLHQRIRSEIEGQILSGAWPPGHRIPYEHELMAAHGCSRMTVNKAMTALAEAGLIERRRRAGSFVARPKVHSAVLDIPDLRSEVTRRGQTYAFRLISSRRRAANGPAESELAAGGALLDLRGLHLAAGRPLAVEHRLISLAVAPEAAGIDFSQDPPGAWLLEHVPWTEAEHRISAVGADAATARLLEIPRGAACLAVDRRTWRGPTHVTQVRQLFPGEAYDLVARFGSSRGG